MAVVETERKGQVLIVRMNRPERLNALNAEMRQKLAETWTEFRHSKELEVAIFTGTGRGFCAGEDMKESLATGKPGGTRPTLPDPFMDGTLEKPVIAAVNGFAMGGGFMLVERTDLRVAVPEAVFEVSEAKRWLLGGYNHGHLANVPYPIAMEMALGFRFTAERFYQVGFLNRLAPQAELIPTAMAMAEHLLSLPPASRVNTVHMMRQMRPEPSAAHKALAAKLHDHGDKSDLMESRAAFSEKRKPNFKGWLDPRGPLPDAEARGRQVTAAIAQPEGWRGRVTEWLETYRGVVNPWECDVVQHFTIAYYFDRFADATRNFFDLAGVGDSLDAGVRDGPSRGHATFQHELRAGAGFHILTAVTGIDAGTLQLGHQVVDSTTGKTVTWLAETRALSKALPSATSQKLAALSVPWPGPKVPDRPAPRASRTGR